MDGLSDQHAIEDVTMVERQLAKGSRVLAGERQKLEAALLGDHIGIEGNLELSGRALDHQLHAADGAEEDPIDRRLQSLAALRAEPCRLAHRPEEDVRIEQDIQRSVLVEHRFDLRIGGVEILRHVDLALQQAELALSVGTVDHQIHERRVVLGDHDSLAV